jgi:hypothetical protein
MAPDQDTGEETPVDDVDDLQSTEPLTGSGAPPASGDDVYPAPTDVEDEEEPPAEQPEPVVHGQVVQDNVTDPAAHTTTEADGTVTTHSPDVDVEQESVHGPERAVEVDEEVAPEEE